MKDYSNIKIDLEKNVKKIISVLEENGFEAYAVGGCVRDAILKKEPSDWDITTNALPEDIKKFFKRSIDTGIEHGTVTVLVGSKSYEVTTYRLDGDYSDLRHPDIITYTSKLKDDLKRRDFTINAMAYNDKEGLVDLFNGIEDLNNGIIRCVGNPIDRFNEDALRILRAIRFSAQLGFKIDNDTQNAISKLKDNLKYISIERINIEFSKLLTSSNPNKLEDIFKYKINEIIFKDNYYNEVLSSNRKCMYELLKKSNDDIVTRLTCFFSYPYIIGNINIKEININTDTKVKEILKSLRYDNITSRIVSTLVYYLKSPILCDKESIRYLIRGIGRSYYNTYIQLKRNIIELLYSKSIEEFEKEVTLANEIIKDNNPLYVKELCINGNDIIDIGIKDKRNIGIVMDELLKDVLNNPENNNRNFLLNRTKNIIKSIEGDSNEL